VGTKEESKAEAASIIVKRSVEERPSKVRIAV
jgi:hypothetical protein